MKGLMGISKSLTSLWRRVRNWNALLNTKYGSIGAAEINFTAKKLFPKSQISFTITMLNKASVKIHGVINLVRIQTIPEANRFRMYLCNACNQNLCECINRRLRTGRRCDFLYPKSHSPRRVVIADVVTF